MSDEKSVYIHSKQFLAFENYFNFGISFLRILLEKFTTWGRVLLLNVRQTFSLLIKKKCFSFHMMKGWKVAKNASFFVKVCYLLLFVIGVKIRLDLSKYPKMMLGL
jgi:hypothetical protein